MISVDTADFLFDVGDIPITHATTNPTLIAAAAKLPQSKELLTANPLSFAVSVGIALLKRIPGHVSTQIDPRLSFDTNRSIEAAKKIIGLYEESHVPRERVRIKLAATWESIEAAKILEKEGIRCNMTLLFSLRQAISCAEAGVSLIAPYVARATDWYQENGIPFESEPGISNVLAIHSHLKSHGFKTEIMAASFRNTNQIKALTCCDILTISPKLLKELTFPLENIPYSQEIPPYSEYMAQAKLFQGLQVFTQDFLQI